MHANALATAVVHTQSPDLIPSATRVAWRDVLGFSVLAYGLSWLWWASIVWPYIGLVTWSGRLPNGLGENGAGHAALGMFGPAIAAPIMHAIHGTSAKGTLGIRRPWRYYLIAVLAPALFVAAVILIDLGAGLGRFVSSGRWLSLPPLCWSSAASPAFH